MIKVLHGMQAFASVEWMGGWVERIMNAQRMCQQQQQQALS